MGPESAANIQAVASGNHYVEQEKRRRLTLGIRNYIVGRVENSGCKACGLKMMLYKPRDVGVVFQYKYGLAQPGCLSPAAIRFPGVPGEIHRGGMR